MGKAACRSQGLLAESWGEVLVLRFPVRPSVVDTTLTAAEREVVQRVLDGDTTRQIATARRTSPHTVSNQLQSIFRKLGIASRAELARCFAGTPADND